MGLKGAIGRLYDLLLSKIDVEQFYADHLGEAVDFGGGSQKNVWCCFHPESNAPSLSLTTDGKFYCHNGGCNAKGGNVIQFVERLKNYSLPVALEYLYGKYIRPTIPGHIAEQYHSNLLAAPAMLNWLKTERGLLRATIDEYKIGFDNHRLTIPIWNEFGHLINIRRYDYTKTHDVKMLPYAAGYGGVALYPFIQVWASDIVICEGEWDALLLIQNGFNAVTATAGVGSWDEQWNELFRGRRVWICFDTNDHLDVGQKCAVKRAKELSFWAQEIRIVKLPLTNQGGDVTDYLHGSTKLNLSGHTAADFAALMEGAELVSKAPTTVKKKIKLDGTAIYELPLDEASKSKYYHEHIATKAVVIGKETSPYIVPSCVSVSCPTAMCQNCPFGGRGTERVDLLEDPTNALLLADRSKESQWEAIRQITEVPVQCQAVIQPTEHCNLEGLQLVPETSFETGASSYVVRTALSLGHGLKSNQAYRFEGVTATDRKQHAVHVMIKNEPSQTAIESFVLTDEIREQLRIFQTEDIDAKLAELYRHLSINATRILQRPDLHMAIDLVFHSPLSFRFNNEIIRKGWLEALVVGDTRTGKGYVAEGLVRYYQLGGVTSCENTSFAGLIGGVEQIDKKWYVKWGKVPQYDRRLLILDEASALRPEQIQLMSRVRSEGKAEVTKIHTEETWARTRLVWLANPRNGLQMADHNTGVEAIRELVGRNEDIARFDYAITVAANEVPSKVINAKHTTRVLSPYTPEVCRHLVLWVWSRTEDQVSFDSDATEMVLRYAKDLGVRYSPAIPLVQSENIRIKVGKIAAAIAARVFSTDTTGQKLVVKTIHVEAAVRFLNACYTKPSMGYNRFSNTTLDRDAIKTIKAIDDRIDGLADRALDFVEGCLELSTITPGDLMDYTGETKEWAVEMISTLVRERALRKQGPAYAKKPAFIAYLQTKRDTFKTNGTPAKQPF